MPNYRRPGLLTVTNRQLVLLLGLWERKATRGQYCRALTQAADKKFGPPPLCTTDAWQVVIDGQNLDVVTTALQSYSGPAPPEAAAEAARPGQWAPWADEWKEDVHMHDHPLSVHCSGLGGGLLSPDHDYDLFFQNHAQ